MQDTNKELKRTHKQSKWNIQLHVVLFCDGTCMYSLPATFFHAAMKINLRQAASALILDMHTGNFSKKALVTWKKQHWGDKILQK